MIVRDLRARVGDTRKERRFSDIGKSDETYVRDHLQLQDHVEFTALLTWLCIFRHLHRRRRVMHVALASASALQNDNAAVLMGHVRDDFAGFSLTDNGALGNLYHKVLAVSAVTAVVSAGFSVLCTILADEAEIIERVQTVIHLKDQIAAATAVAAVRTAGRNEFFAPEADMAVTAVAGTDIDFCRISKHYKPPQKKKVPFRLSLERD